jgi:hypothetical protein
MKTARHRTRSTKAIPSPEDVARDAMRHFRNKPLTEQRALLIKWEILNPNGTLRRYPMDHVPYGPRA